MAPGTGRVSTAAFALKSTMVPLFNANEVVPV